MSDDLVAFLRASLNDDEVRATARRHSPARVLREVEAGRAIVELHNRTHECPVSSVEHHPEKGDWLYISVEYVEEGGSEWPCTTLRHLAAVYADHPDYQQEWKP